MIPTALKQQVSQLNTVFLPGCLLTLALDLLNRKEVVDRVSKSRGSGTASKLCSKLALTQASRGQDIFWHAILKTKYTAMSDQVETLQSVDTT